jgi:hypothetical protein
MVEVAPSAKELADSQDKTKPGATLSVPPAAILTTINKQIDSVLDAMPKDKKGNLVMSVETKSGVNLALVQKLDKDGDWTVTAYIGKKWDAPLEGGVYVSGKW